MKEMKQVRNMYLCCINKAVEFQSGYNALLFVNNRMIVKLKEFAPIEQIKRIQRVIKMTEILMLLN